MKRPAAGDERAHRARRHAPRHLRGRLLYLAGDSRLHLRDHLVKLPLVLLEEGLKLLARCMHVS